MIKFKENNDYMQLVEDILNNDNFNKLKRFKHHGVDRFTHSIHVSYHSYKIAKALRLDYKSAARAGLLHDFFLVNNQQIKKKDRIKVLIKHPKFALYNSKELFNLNKKEENIIISHMFPFNLRLPKYIESIIVNVVDDTTSIGERILCIFNKEKRFKNEID